MPIGIIILAVAYLDRQTAAILLGFSVLCKLVAYLRSTQLLLQYSNSNPLFKEFVEKTEIATMKFECYIFAPTPVLQSIIYLIKEETYKLFWAETFDRELLTLSEDGGTVGLDWDGGIPDPEAKDKQPILAVCPGLGGGAHNLYSLGLIWAARKAGFKCCTVLFRGCEGLPVTTPILSYAGSWRDCQFVMEHIDKKYVRDAKTG